MHTSGKMFNARVYQTHYDRIFKPSPEKALEALHLTFTNLPVVFPSQTLGKAGHHFWSVA